MKEQEKLTDESFWDERWTEEFSGATKLSPMHPYYGKNGIFMKMVTERLGSIEGKRILELGGGGFNKRLVALAKWGGAKVSAIDFSQDALKGVEAMFKINEVELGLIEGDFFTADYPEQYDLIVHWGVLEHFTETDEFFKLCNRLLNDQGKMLFSMPNLKSFAASLWPKYSPDLASKHILHEEITLETSAQKAGLALKEHFYFGIPTVALSAPEISGPLARLFKLTQWALNRSSAVIPFYHKGSEKISMERGFFLEKE